MLVHGTSIYKPSQFSFDLLEFHVHFEPRETIKYLVLADFIEEMTHQPWTNFKSRKNQSEYEALIVGLQVAREMGVSHLQVNSNSQLVLNQVKWEYHAMEETLVSHLNKVKSLMEKLKDVQVSHIPWGDNTKDGKLAKLASIKASSQQKFVVFQTKQTPNIFDSKVYIITANLTRMKDIS